MRSQRSGERSTRRSDGKPLLLEERAVDAVGGDHEVLDQLLRAVLLVGPQVGERAVVEHRRAPRSSRARARPCAVATRFSALRDRVLQAQLLVEPRAPPPASAAAAGALEPRRDGVVGELGVVAHDARGRRRTRVTAPSASTVISMTTASRSSPSSSDVRSVESFSGSIGKISAAV